MVDISFDAVLMWFSMLNRELPHAKISILLGAV